MSYNQLWNTLKHYVHTFLSFLDQHPYVFIGLLIGDVLVQRKLYSAYLLQHVGIDGITVDIEGCKSDFDTFLRNQEFTMSQLTTDLKSVGKEYFN